MCPLNIKEKNMSNKAKNVVIPRPSVQEVEKYQKEWESLNDYKAREEALDKLFGEYAKRNKDLSDILIKVSALNDFYSTNIYSVYDVATHIAEVKDLDKRLQAGDISLVDEIKRVDFNGKTWNFYSFASKYCSHHNPTAFPIYDIYVGKVLAYFKNCKDVEGKSFATFSIKGIKESYKAFYDVIVAFRKAYGLEAYTLKQIDRYLWLLGKEHFTKNYNKD